MRSASGKGAEDVGVARCATRSKRSGEGKELTETRLPQPVQVTCYSGRIYADRPSSFVWQDRKYEVKEVEKEWQEPGERHFQVLTQDDKRFELCYDEGQDQWSMTEII